MKQRLIYMGLFLFAVFGGLIAFNTFKHLLRDVYLKERTPPPFTVSASTAKDQTWHPTLQAIGTTTALQQVNVTTQVAGKVTGILFEDGQQVNEGDLLVKLEDSVQKAQLDNAKASQALAADTITRYRPLLAKGAISQYQFDKYKAQLKEAQAQTEQAQANLDYVHIRAPFSGRLGIRQVNLGQFVQAGADIVSLDTQGSLFADFTFPEKDFSKVTVDQKVQLTTDSVPGRNFTGKVTAKSPQVDPTTRNFSVRASFPNEDNALAPGVFANINVYLPQQENVVTLPKTAVSYTLYGDTAYVLDPKTKSKRHGKIAYQVKKVSITPGMERENEIAISKGIQAGDRVVTSGQLKLQDGAWVTIKEDPLTPPETMPLQ